MYTPQAGSLRMCKFAKRLTLSDNNQLVSWATWP